MKNTRRWPAGLTPFEIGVYYGRRDRHTVRQVDFDSTGWIDFIRGWRQGWRELVAHGESRYAEPFRKPLKIVGRLQRARIERSGTNAEAETALAATLCHFARFSMFSACVVLQTAQSP